MSELLGSEVIPEIRKTLERPNDFHFPINIEEIGPGAIDTPRSGSLHLSSRDEHLAVEIASKNRKRSMTLTDQQQIEALAQQQLDLACDW